MNKSKFKQTYRLIAAGLAIAGLLGLGGNYAYANPGDSNGIEVTSPTSGSDYKLSDQVPIRWNNLSAGAQVVDVKISLIPYIACLYATPSCDVPSPAPYVITNSTADDGVYNWTVPSDLPSTYIGDVFIKVETVSNTLSGESDVFRITDSAIGDAHPVGSLLLGLNNRPNEGWLVVNINNVVKRKVFPSAEIFMSHGYKWNRFVTGNSADQNLPSAGNMTFAPGSVIKSNTSPTVYLVTAGQTLRPFSTWSSFTGLGYTASMIWTMPDINLGDYAMSSSVTSVERHVDGTEVVRNGTVYYINGGQLHPYTSLTIYNSWHTNNNDFSRVVPANSFDNLLPIGEFQTERQYPN